MFITEAKLTYKIKNTEKSITFSFLIDFMKPKFDGINQFLQGLINKMPELSENVNEKFYKGMILKKYNEYVEKESFKYINFFIINRLLGYFEQSNNELIIFNTYCSYDTKTIFAVDYERRVMNVYLNHESYFFGGLYLNQIKSDICKFLLSLDNITCCVGDVIYTIKFHNYNNNICDIQKTLYQQEFKDYTKFDVNEKILTIKKIKKSISSYIKNRDNYSVETSSKFHLVTDNRHVDINKNKTETEKHEVWVIYHKNDTNPMCDYIIRKSNKIYKPNDYRLDFIDDGKLLNLYSNIYHFPIEYGELPQGLPKYTKLVNNPILEIKRLTKTFDSGVYDLNLLHCFLRVISNIVYDYGKKTMWDIQYGRTMDIDKKKSDSVISHMKSYYDSLFVLNDYYEIIGRINDIRHKKLLLDVLNDIEMDILNVLICLKENERDNTNLIKRRYRIKYNDVFEQSSRMFLGLSTTMSEDDFNESYLMSYYDQLLRFDTTNSSIYKTNLKKLKTKL